MTNKTLLRILVSAVIVLVLIGAAIIASNGAGPAADVSPGFFH